MRLAITGLLLAMTIGLLGGSRDATAQTAGANYPMSEYIMGLTWDSQIVRRGCGDNVPVTWADDDLLYAALGECYGFTNDGNQSLNCVQITDTGDPLGFSGSDIDCQPKQTGWGQQGLKASGMLSIDGVLYMLLRNADHDGHRSQLAWSADSGRSWTYANWTHPFGYPSFLNFGKDYSGAGDNYVYVYSPDTDSAYNPSSDSQRQGMVLARIDRTRLRDLSAWEYFVRTDNGNPVWTNDIEQRGLVFQCKNSACMRHQISYDAGIGRYLWWQQVYAGTVDTRDSGGFGIYEAEEPWGPWHTVWFSNDATKSDFADAPGEGGVFPTKWMSADGRDLHLICSCKNAFTVRKATLSIAADAIGTSTPASQRATTAPAMAPDSIGGARYRIAPGDTYIEAEAPTGSTLGDWTSVDDEAASRATYLQAPESHSGPPLEFHIRTEYAGKIYVWLRMIGGDDTSGVTIGFDGGVTQPVATDATAWRWVLDNDAFAELSAGDHVISIGVGSPHAKLDKLLIRTGAPGGAPTSTGGLAQPRPSRAP